MIFPSSYGPINMARPGAAVQQSPTWRLHPSRISDAGPGRSGAGLPLVVATSARCLPERAVSASAEVNW